MTDKDLIIINNEKIFKENSNFYCDNLDLKVLPELSLKQLTEFVDVYWNRI